METPALEVGDKKRSCKAERDGHVRTSDRSRLPWCCRRSAESQERERDGTERADLDPGPWQN